MRNTRSRRNTKNVDFGNEEEKEGGFSFKRKRSDQEQVESNKRRRPTPTKQAPVVVDQVETQEMKLSETDRALAAGLEGEKKELFRILCQNLAIELEEARKTYSGSQQVTYGCIVAAFHALKHEFLVFLTTKEPKELLDELPNAVNVKNQKKITALQQKLSRLQNEQQKWLQLVEDRTTKQKCTEIKPPKVSLSASEEVEKAHQDIYSKIAKLPGKLGVIECSVHTLNRMIMKAELKQKEMLQRPNRSSRVSLRPLHDFLDLYLN